jgi:hypothetical protein
MSKDEEATRRKQGILDLEAMWSALLAADWTTLAVVPTDQGASVQEVVDTLLTTSADRDPPVHCFDARGVDVEEAKRLAGRVETSRAKRGRAVVIVDPLIRSLAGVHLVRDADGILLVVTVRATELDSLTSTVSMLGSSRILGSVTAPLTDR